MKRLLILSVLFAASAYAQTPDEDFASRCAAEGVISCYALDTEQQLQSQQVVNAADGTRQGFIDTINKVSGAGSLRFKLRAGISALNIGGAWSADLGQAFGAGDTMYVMFRWRISPNVLTNNLSAWDSSIKLTNIHGPTLTCQGTEFTMTLRRGAGGQRLDSYRACGTGFPTSVTTNALLTACGGGDCLLQQASQLADGTNVGYNCHFQNQITGSGNGNGCFFPEPGVWYTIYQRLGVGTYGGSTTTYDAWVQREGGPMLQFHRVAGIPWTSGDTTFTKVRLETYMSEIEGAASNDAYVWYDELIISTQPIAAPVGVPPKKPTGVTAGS